MANYSYCEHLNTRSTMSLIYLQVVAVEFRTECHFVTEYARNTNEKAGEGETNLRGFDMWSEAQYNVADISTCRHRGISNRVPLRN